MDLNIIKKIITLLEESNLRKIHLRDGDFEISLEKDEGPKKHRHHHEKEHKEPPIKEEKKPPPKENTDEKDCILSPMVGTYYYASAPDQPQFVKVGDRVDEDTVVCIIEAMKVMNEIKAGRKGIIKEVLVENAQPVEFGTKLFLVEP